MKYLIVIVSTILFINVSKGQSYLQEDIQWKVYKSSGGSPNGTTYTHSTYQISGDTIIQGINYKKLEETFDIIKVNPYSLDTIIYKIGEKRIHAIREENKAFYVSGYPGGNISGDVEYLSIDFNLEIGDTIRFNDIHPNNGSDIVSKIDSFEFENEFRKIYTTKYNYTFYEGIGTQFGPIQVLYDWGDEVWHRLLCIETENNNYKLDYFTTDNININYCDNQISILSSIESTITQNDITFYPNPVVNNITIEINEIINKVQINSIAGNMVLEKDNLNTKERTIDISNLEYGVYIIIIENRLGHLNMCKIIR